jgi:hypothetical protein
VNSGENIQLECGIDVLFAVDRAVIFGDLDCAGFVFVNWRLKEKSQALSSLPGKRAEEY